MSMCTFGCRRSRKKQGSIHSGRPPWAAMIVNRGKSTATSSRVIGSPYLLRASGKIDVPVWTMRNAERLGPLVQRGEARQVAAVAVGVGEEVLMRRVELEDPNAVPLHDVLDRPGR